VNRILQREAKADALPSGAGKAGGAAGASAPACGSGPRAHQVIKLGIDVHLDRYVVVRQIDGGAPQPAQGFSPTQFLDWARKQTALAQQVYSCYEAGPFGYSLHRKLAGFGITNYVVRPRDWDEYGKNVKTDKRDAKALVLGLDRYVAGNQDAFCVVRVPTEAQEQARSRSRQRESLQKEKQRLAAQGRSHALYYGAHIKGIWWTEALTGKEHGGGDGGNDFLFFSAHFRTFPHISPWKPMQQSIVECRGLTAVLACMASQDGAGTLYAGRQDACPTVERIGNRDRGWRQEGGGRAARVGQARLAEEPFERRACGGYNVHGGNVYFSYT